MNKGKIKRPILQKLILIIGIPLLIAYSAVLIINYNVSKAAALKQTNGNQSEASRLLGVSRVTVYNRMKKYGISLNRLPQDY